MIPVMVRLIETYEWRMAIVILAIGLLVIGLPFSLLVRHKPEHYGYLPDGEIRSAMISDASLVMSSASKASIGIRQVMKTRVFWHIVLGLMPMFLAVPAVTTHVMPYLSSIGVTRSISGLVATGYSPVKYWRSLWLWLAGRQI